MHQATISTFLRAATPQTHTVIPPEESVKAPSRQRDCRPMKIDMTTMDPERMKKVWFHAHALAHVFYLLSLSVSLSHLS
jgi:hypothetical protein